MSGLTTGLCEIADRSDLDIDVVTLREAADALGRGERVEAWLRAKVREDQKGGLSSGAWREVGRFLDEIDRESYAGPHDIKLSPCSEDPEAFDADCLCGWGPHFETLQEAEEGMQEHAAGTERTDVAP